MARAYVLVKADVGHAERVQEALARLPGVRDADIVTGEYDLIVVIEVPDAREIGRLIMREIHGLPGITSTNTYVVVG